eukprot:PhM_4_TR9646/c0_g1_i1/m.72742
MIMKIKIKKTFLLIVGVPRRGGGESLYPSRVVHKPRTQQRAHLTVHIRKGTVGVVQCNGTREHVPPADGVREGNRIVLAVPVDGVVVVVVVAVRRRNGPFDLLPHALVERRDLAALRLFLVGGAFVRRRRGRRRRRGLGRGAAAGHELLHHLRRHAHVLRTADAAVWDAAAVVLVVVAVLVVGGGIGRRHGRAALLVLKCLALAAAVGVLLRFRALHVVELLEALKFGAHERPRKDRRDAGACRRALRQQRRREPAQVGAVAVGVEGVVGHREHLVAQLLEGLRRPRLLERHQLVGDDASREEIGLVVVRLLPELLGRQVVRGAAQGLRHVERVRELLREAEVAELRDAAARDEDVRRLEVAVEDVVRVHVAQREQDLDHPLEHLVLAEGTVLLDGVLDAALEVPGLGVLHHDEERAVVLQCLDDLHDVGVPQRLQQPHLLAGVEHLLVALTVERQLFQNVLEAALFAPDDADTTVGALADGLDHVVLVPR